MGVPVHAALVAANGGPLPVTPRAQREAAVTEESYELLALRFTAVVSLPPRQALTLRAGQRATVSYRPWNKSVGEHLFHAASNWLRQRLKPPEPRK